MAPHCAAAAAQRRCGRTPSAQLREIASELPLICGGQLNNALKRRLGYRTVTCTSQQAVRRDIRIEQPARRDEIGGAEAQARGGEAAMGSVSAISGSRRLSIGHPEHL